jgi:methionyl-tRNA formyltransferase
VKAVAERLGIPVSHDVDDVIGLHADLGVVVAFGRLIKPHVLAALPMINVHFSLLPRWRGAAPVERAILAGDDKTGVCIMDVEEGLDTGAVYRCQEVTIDAEETAAELTGRLATVGADLLVGALAEGLGEPTPQHGEPTYAAKIEPEDLHLDWTRPAAELHRVVRVGRAWTTWRGHRLLVWRAEETEAASPPGSLQGAVAGTGRGGLRLVLVQPEGKPIMSGEEWLKGARPRPDERLGT